MSQKVQRSLQVEVCTIANTGEVLDGVEDILEFILHPDDTPENLRFCFGNIRQSFESDVLLSREPILVNKGVEDFGFVQETCVYDVNPDFMLHTEDGSSTIAELRKNRKLKDVKEYIWEQVKSELGEESVLYSRPADQ